MTIIVGSTMAAFCMGDEEIWGSWLSHAEEMQVLGERGGYEVKFFAAIEVDARGVAPFEALIDRLAELDGEYFTFSLDDGRTEVHTNNRLRHITMGQNIVSDYCCADPSISHLLFLAADCEPPADAIDKLLEMNHPIVGGEVPTYGLHGPPVDGYSFPVEAHMATAAFVMLNRYMIRHLRWRWDLETGMTDDPCLHYDALKFHGTPTFVRKDCVGVHHPQVIGPVEQRGHDMKVHR